MAIRQPKCIDEMCLDFFEGELFSWSELRIAQKKAGKTIRRLPT